jgi:predicted membrane protein
MQIIDKNRNHASWLNPLLVALVFIAVGLLLIGNNMGLIDYSLFHILVSWQMLLIVIGISQFIKRNDTAGFILIGIGAFFLIPRVIGYSHDWVGTYWPVIFIIVGIGLILNIGKVGSCGHYRRDRFHRFNSEPCKTDNGFVNSSNTFGSVRQIVLDPVFKGARISNSFGGTVLDLRRTSLEAPETYIDIESTFGGIEIYVPSTWYVEINTSNVAGGSDDKRFTSRENVDFEHKLIIRGSNTFGGIEVKS